MFIVDTDLCFNFTSTLIDENSDFFFVEYFRKRKKNISMKQRQFVKMSIFFMLNEISKDWSCEQGWSVGATYVQMNKDKYLCRFPDKANVWRRIHGCMFLHIILNVENDTLTWEILSSHSRQTEIYFNDKMCPVNILKIITTTIKQNVLKVQFDDYTQCTCKTIQTDLFYCFPGEEIR